MKTLRLKKREARRVLRGHPWIFSNEIVEMPKDLSPGDLVEIHDFSGVFIGRGYANPHTLIAVRLLTRAREEITNAFFRKKIETARDLRVSLGFGDSFRALFSEGDGLPGLIIDKYADVIVLQCLTAGIERQMNIIIDVLKDVYSPTAIVLRNDSPSRQIEGLAVEKKVVHGAINGPVLIEESGLRYSVDVFQGQKTGFFFDQRENRLALRDYVKDRRVLDCFCYVGAWSLTAAHTGAREVTGIDSSANAIIMARENAALNGLTVDFRKADVFEELTELNEKKDRYGCIILDPPAFAKSRSKAREALKGYKEINLRALRMIEPGGILVTCSCSHHINEELFREMLIDAAHSARRETKLLEMRSQARDHPMLLAARETQYLKCAILRVE
jgi:23S rRNA (cytosine1962-C5)-methyltransferase